MLILELILCDCDCDDCEEDAEEAEEAPTTEEDPKLLDELAEVDELDDDEADPEPALDEAMAFTEDVWAVAELVVAAEAI